MSRIVATFVLFAAFAGCTRENFGVAGQGSLGDATRLDAIFVEKQLVKASKDVDLRELDLDAGSEDVARPGRCVSYTDDARANDVQTAKLYYDASGAFVGMKVHYRSDERSYDKGFYKISRVLFDYWNEVGGKGATFEIAGGGIPILGKEALVARFENGAVRGRWVKQVFDGNMRDRVEDEVTIQKR